MNFHSPIYFLVLILIPLYFIFLQWEKNKQKNKSIWISVFEDLKTAQGNSWYKYLPWIKNGLIVIIIALFAIVLARPQNSYETKDISKKGIDIIIALDVSQSMLAEDLKPNRLEAAKESIKKFVQQIESDRLGIIAFSGKAFTQSPLTFDYNIITEYIDSISIETINQNVRGLAGTALGDAILAAINRFEQSEDRTKVLILLTDGDANMGINPVTASKKAAKENVKIYTIGIGNESGAPIPIIDRFGNKQILTNPDGSPLLAKFNEESLKKLAQIGDGQYFRVDDSQSFEKALEEIDNLQKREIKISKNKLYTENFYPFLMALGIAVIIYILIERFFLIKV
jgi:Ca-activated chloride channel family protein